MTLAELPKELLMLISHFLDGDDPLRLSLTNKYVHQCCVHRLREQKYTTINLRCICKEPTYRFRTGLRALPVLREIGLDPSKASFVKHVHFGDAQGHKWGHHPSFDGDQAQWIPGSDVWRAATDRRCR